MSQAELASIVGNLDQSAIARIERGLRVVSIEEAQEIASALGASVLDLLSGVGEEGEMLFFARVIRPMRQLQARFDDPEGLLEGLSDGSIPAIVAQLNDGVEAFSNSALDPATLIESGQSIGNVMTLSRGLLDRYEVFGVDLREALKKLSKSDENKPVRERSERKAQAARVVRRS